MTLHTRSEFFRSQLYQGYQRQLYSDQYLGLVKQVYEGTAIDLSKLNKLAGPSKGTDYQSSVEFGIAWFALGEADKAKFLCEKDSRFDELSKWQPSHRLLALRPFANPKTPWPKMSLTDIVRGFECIRKDSLQELVANPTVKVVAGHYMQIGNAILNIENETAKAAVQKVCRAVLLEMMHLKFGVTVDPTEQCTADDVKYFGETPELKQLVRNVLKHYGENRKSKRKPGPNIDLLAVETALTNEEVAAEIEAARKQQEIAAAKAAEKEAAQKEAKAAESRDGEPARVPASDQDAAGNNEGEKGGDENSKGADDRKDDDTPEGSMAAEGGESGLDQDLVIEVGSDVVTKAGKNKASYDNKRGIVTKVLSQKYRVKISEGVATGEERDFMKKDVVRYVSPEDRAAKKRKTAGDLFGAVLE